jgi:hypothetical protein
MASKLHICTFEHLHICTFVQLYKVTEIYISRLLVSKWSQNAKGGHSLFYCLTKKQYRMVVQRNVILVQVVAEALAVPCGDLTIDQ